MKKQKLSQNCKIPKISPRFAFGWVSVWGGFLKKKNCVTKSIGLVIRGKCELAILQYASDSYREDTQFSKLGFPHYSLFVLLISCSRIWMWSLFKNTNKPLNFESVKSQVCSCWGPLDCMRHLMTQDMSLAVISLISPMKPIVHYQWL